MAVDADAKLTQVLILTDLVQTPEKF